MKKPARVNARNTSLGLSAGRCWLMPIRAIGPGSPLLPANGPRGSADGLSAGFPDRRGWHPGPLRGPPPTGRLPWPDPATQGKSPRTRPLRQARTIPCSCIPPSGSASLRSYALVAYGIMQALLDRSRGFGAERCVLVPQVGDVVANVGETLLRQRVDELVDILTYGRSE